MVILRPAVPPDVRKVSDLPEVRFAKIRATPSFGAQPQYSHALMEARSASPHQTAQPRRFFG